MNKTAEEPRDIAALLVGGRAGVGKSTVSWEISAQLEDARIAHAHVEGDFLDRVFPAPEGDPNRSAVTEANLAAIWANFAAAGCRRLIYTNTVSVLEPDLIDRALGGAVRLTRVLLTAEDGTARDRLAGREIGGELDAHLRRSASAARYLEEHAPTEVVRIRTDRRPVVEIAREIIAATGWAAGPADGWS